MVSANLGIYIDKLEEIIKAKVYHLSLEYLIRLFAFSYSKIKIAAYYNKIDWMIKQDFFLMLQFRPVISVADIKTRFIFRDYWPLTFFYWMMLSATRMDKQYIYTHKQINTKALLLVAPNFQTLRNLLMVYNASWTSV